MKIKIAALLAAILGVLSIFLFLVAFGTDYWLLVTEKCGGFEAKNSNLSSEKDGKHVWKEGDKGILTFHHEGFFWRCWFFGEDYKATIWNFWFTSQAHPKHCMNAYLFPMPIVSGPHPHPSYDATAGSLFTVLVFMFVVWKEFAADLRKYILLERSERCPDDTPLSVYYGWSFMFVAAGIPLVLSSGLLFYLVGHTILKELE
ncbi:transmembrane protein 182-like isoform X2 [Crotalus tigris]|uniref:transmembrane protein 182-like isoform X2 n=1 Tax=Crotalus tigris TaxID=88082 RepID=UPI00192F7EAF|nr:transmembrane protein 182-like isoform X2 [Crotalus tigris]